MSVTEEDKPRRHFGRHSWRQFITTVDTSQIGVVGGTPPTVKSEGSVVVGDNTPQAPINSGNEKGGASLPETASGARSESSIQTRGRFNTQT